MSDKRLYSFLLIWGQVSFEGEVERGSNKAHVRNLDIDSEILQQ